jgi:hypothetical protein
MFLARPGVTAVILVQVLTSGTSSFVIPAISSEFSNLIISAKVGSPPQTLPVGIAFDRKHPWLYSAGECPPYVQCFESTDSISFECRGENRVIATGGDTLEGFSCFDRFKLSEDIEFDSDCEHINFSQSRLLTGRDTAGRISYGPTSALAQRSVLEIKADLPIVGKAVRGLPRWSLTMNPVVEALDPDQIEIGASVTTNSNSWKLDARIFVNGTEVFRRIPLTFIPDIDDLIVPASDQAAVLARLLPNDLSSKVGYAGRLFVPCQSAPGPANTYGMNKIMIRFQPDLSRYIILQPHSLQYSGLVNAKSIFTENGVRYCPTRMVFKQGARGWTVGIPLVTSVQTIRLDATQSKAFFRLTRNSAQRPLSVVIPQTNTVEGYNIIPRFAFPEVVESGSGLRAKVSVRFTSEWSSIGDSQASDFILYNHDPESEDEGSKFRYHFLKMQESLLSPKVSVSAAFEIKGLQQTAKMEARRYETVEEGYVVSFDFSAPVDPDSASYFVTLIDRGQSVEVLLTKVDTYADLKHYDVPKTVVATEADEMDRCAVCIADFLKGDRIQALECGNKFHPECVERWLGKTRSCSACRLAVKFKSTVGSFMLRQVITTPELEVDINV